jgi:hypothetical protein
VNPALLERIEEEADFFQIFDLREIVTAKLSASASTDYSKSSRSSLTSKEKKRNDKYRKDTNNSRCSNRLVELNVGGRVFTTALSTLTQKSGYFKNLFETGTFPKEKNSSKPVFFDRGKET